MTIIDFSVLLIGAFFGFYSLCSAVEYGVVIKMLAKDKPSRRMFTPLWELTNVWLVFGFTALAMLFNNALPVLSQPLLATAIVGLGLMLARACLVIWLFYIRDEDVLSPWLVWLFGLSSFSVPLTFSAAGIYLLTGHLFWQTGLGAALMLAAASGLVGAGMVIITRNDGARLRLLARMSFVVWLFSIGSLVPEAAINTRSSLARGPLMVIVGMSALALLFTALPAANKKILWPIAAGMSFVVPVLLAWSNRPFLVAGKLSLNQAYGAQSYGRVVVVGLAIMAPLIVFGLIVFARLYGALPKSLS